MKLGVLVLASLVVSLAGIAGLSFNTAASDILACPDWLCIYTNAQNGPDGIEGYQVELCWGVCDDCCNEFESICDRVAGNPSCWCVENPNKKPCYMK